MEAICVLNHKKVYEDKSYPRVSNFSSSSCLHHRFGLVGEGIVEVWLVAELVLVFLKEHDAIGTLGYLCNV